jgi:hypothetical protein
VAKPVTEHTKGAGRESEGARDLGGGSLLDEEGARDLGGGSLLDEEGAQSLVMPVPGCRRRAEEGGGIA